MSEEGKRERVREGGERGEREEGWPLGWIEWGVKKG